MNLFPTNTGLAVNTSPNCEGCPALSLERGGCTLDLDADQVKARKLQRASALALEEVVSAFEGEHGYTIANTTGIREGIGASLDLDEIIEKDDERTKVAAVHIMDTHRDSLSRIGEDIHICPGLDNAAKASPKALVEITTTADLALRFS